MKSISVSQVLRLQGYPKARIAGHLWDWCSVCYKRHRNRTIATLQLSAGMDQRRSFCEVCPLFLWRRATSPDRFSCFPTFLSQLDSPTGSCAVIECGWSRFCASIAAVECFRRTGGDKLLLCLQDTCSSFALPADQYHQRCKLYCN